MEPSLRCAADLRGPGGPCHGAGMSSTPASKNLASPEPRRELAGKLAGKTIPAQLATLAVWPLLEQILGFAVAATDQVLAGRFADPLARLHALDALAVGGYFSWLLMILQGAVGTGGLALIARATGAGDTHLARRALGQTVMLGTGLGILVSLVAIPGIPIFLKAFALTGETAQMASDYLQIIAFSSPLTGFILASNAGLRGSGDTRTPFLIMTIVNTTNIGTSWLFTFGPAPFGGHGVAGLAGGTLLGWVVGALVLAWKLTRVRTNRLTLDRESLRPEREAMARIVRVGLPSAMEILGMWVINTWLLRMVAALPITGALEPISSPFDSKAYRFCRALRWGRQAPPWQASTSGWVIESVLAKPCAPHGFLACF